MPQLYVNVTTLAFPLTDQCVSNIKVQVYNEQNVTLDFSRRDAFTTVELWSKETMSSTNVAEHARDTAQRIEDLTKNFVTDWNFDNRDEKPLRALPEDLLLSPPEPKLTHVEGNPFAPPRASVTQSATPSDVAAGSSATQSEVVQVKYRGPVNLASFACESITRSSFIERVCYDARNNYMLIELNGAWYHYCEIDQGTVSALLGAESLGHFFDTSIKGNFDCRTHRFPMYAAAQLPLQGGLPPTASLAPPESPQIFHAPSAASGQSVATDLASKCANGMPDEKIAACSEAIRQNAKASWAYVNRGDAHLNKSDYDRAVVDATTAIEIDPNNAAAYALRGFAYLNKSYNEKAIADENKAIEIDPKDADAYSFRGLAYVSKKDYDKAIADETKAIEIDPRQAPGYLGRGIAYAGMGEYKRAIADENKAIEIDPRCAANAKENLEEILALQKKKSEK